MVAITSFDRDHIFEAVKLMYTQVANHPEVEYHFPTGRWICEVYLVDSSEQKCQVYRRYLVFLPPQTWFYSMSTEASIEVIALIYFSCLFLDDHHQLI